MLKKIITLFTFAYLLVAAAVTASPHPEIKAVVFDFGGVVAHANRSHLIKFLKDSLQISEQALQPILKEMKTYIAEGGTEREFWLNYTSSIGRPQTEEWFEELESATLNVFTNIPGTLELVKELQKLGYATPMFSNVTEYQASLIRKIGYYNYFNPLLLSYQMGVTKPDAKAYEILLQKLNLPAAAIVFIDDTAENVEAAMQMGIDAILFISAEQLRQELKIRGIEVNDYSEATLK